MATPGSPLDAILPDTDTGTDLANDLNAWALYLASMRRGAARPTELVEGGLWFRETTGSKALMIVVHDTLGGDGNDLSDKVLFSFEDPGSGGGKIFEGIEIFVFPASTPPSSPAQGDLWAIPDGLSVGADAAVTNWELRIYNSGAWEEIVASENANIVLSDTVGVEPTLPDLDKYYGHLWFDAPKDASSPTINNGLKIWNGSAYVSAWPVIAGQTMLKTTTSAGNPSADPDVGLAHINTSDDSFWVATGTVWVDLTDQLTFVSTAAQVEDAISTTLVMSPYWSRYGIEYYRELHTIDRFDVARFGQMVETVSSGAGIGKIDPSLTLTTGLGYQSTFTAVPGTEYPSNPQLGDYYIYLNDPSYTFVDVGGDLEGETIYKGQGVVYNKFGAWEIVDVVLNTDAFVHRDGSLSVYQPLPFTDAVGANEMLLDYQSISIPVGLNFSIIPTVPSADEGLHVSYTNGYVGINEASPAYWLDIETLTDGVRVNQTSSSVTEYFPFGFTGTGILVSGLSIEDGLPGLKLSNKVAAYTVELSPNGVSYFNGGNVGIGESSPAYPLHVDGESQLLNSHVTATGVEINKLGTGDRIALLKLHTNDTGSYRVSLWGNAGYTADAGITAIGAGSFEIDSGAGALNLISGGAFGLSVQGTTSISIDTDGIITFAEKTSISPPVPATNPSAIFAGHLAVVGDIQATRYQYSYNTGRNFLAGDETTGEFLTNGQYNMLIGWKAGWRMTTADYNVAIGTQTLAGGISGDMTGWWNIGIGAGAGEYITSGEDNILLGQEAGGGITTSSSNIGIGYLALYYASGNGNIGIGLRTGDEITSGSNNIALGTDAQVDDPTASNQISLLNLIYAKGGNVGIGTSDPGSKLSIVGLPTSASGLSAGDIWSNSGVLTIV